MASLIVPDVHLVDDLRLDRLARLGQGPAQQDNLKGTVHSIPFHPIKEEDSVSDRVQDSGAILNGQ